MSVRERAHQLSVVYCACLSLLLLLQSLQDFQNKLERGTGNGGGRKDMSFFYSVDSHTTDVCNPLIWR